MEFYAVDFHAMGTRCAIQVFAEDSQFARAAMQAAIDDVNRLEQKYSRYKKDSFLSEINRAAKNAAAIEVDAETASLLNYAQVCYLQSDGLFDISSGLLRSAWQFDSGQLPDPKCLQQLTQKIGWEKLSWQAPNLKFSVKGMELDFGGIVKEYAVDRIASLLRQMGILHGLVNLGGDIKLIGPRADGEVWNIGIQHPRDAGKVLYSLHLNEGALASSGDYARCMILDGKRYSHILNPKTGWPVSHLAAVSVVGDLCVVAGSAATIAILKGEQGPAWLNELGLPHLWVDMNGHCGGSLLT